jgi:hypothetical protein
MYLDRIYINQHCRCLLEPGYATLGIWNVATRNKAEAWRPLGYIPNLYLLSKNVTEERFRDARESQWERVAGESAGGIIPRD